MTPYQKELFSIQLSAVVKTCEKILKKPDDVSEEWLEAIRDMRLRAKTMAEKWSQT